jgi:hypothetical protein
VATGGRSGRCSRSAFSGQFAFLNGEAVSSSPAVCAMSARSRAQ